jgi:hypothetical protein
VDEPDTAGQLGSVETPTPSQRLKAEQAARAGDGAGVIAAYNEALGQFDELSKEEQTQLANSATRIAKQLDEDGQNDQAQVVWTFAALFQARAGRPEHAAGALGAGVVSGADAPIPVAPTRSK